MTSAERIDAAVNAALPIPGWMSEPELRYLATIAVDCHSILEVGSWQGRSSRCLATALPHDGVLYAVDDFRGEEATPIPVHELRGAFMQHLAPQMMLGKVVHFNLPSAEFARLVRQSWFHALIEHDAVLIDGSHRYRNVLQDLTDYWPMVKRGGRMLGHDYHLPEVMRAVRETFPHVKCVAGSIWEVRKGK